MKNVVRLICVALLAAALLPLGAPAQDAPAKKGRKNKAGKVQKATRTPRAKKVVVVWSEGTAPKNVYPNDINGAVADGLKASLKGWEVITANIDQPDQGLPDELLNRTSVLIWWGHKRHNDVKDELVDKIVKRVKEDGMGFIALHSSHFSKPNKALMGTPCSWGAYKGDSTTLDVTVKDPSHPIAKGVKNFTIDHAERYSEPYAVNPPEAVVFEGVHHVKDGSTDPSRVGMTWTVGKGKFFYLQAGHETSPVFFDKNIQQIMANAVKWAAPAKAGAGKGKRKGKKAAQ